MERVIFEATVKYKSPVGSVHSDRCRDLSLGGLFLQTECPFDIDQTITLKFSIPAQDKEISISCTARVAWTNLAAKRLKVDYPSGVGLQFLDLSREGATALSKFIDRYDETKKMNVLCAWCGVSLGMRRGPVGKISHGICDQCRVSLN